MSSSWLGNRIRLEPALTNHYIELAE